MVTVLHLVSHGHNAFEINACRDRFLEKACRDRFLEKAYKDFDVFLDQELGL